LARLAAAEDRTSSTEGTRLIGRRRTISTQTSRRGRSMLIRSNGLWATRVRAVRIRLRTARWRDGALTAPEVR